MLCKNCGNGLDDGARFCPGCGSPAGAAAVYAAPVVPPKKNSKTPVVIAIAAVLVIGLAVALVFALTRESRSTGGKEAKESSSDTQEAAIAKENNVAGYKKVVEQYFAAMEQGSGKLMLELFPKEYLEYWEYDSEQELIEDLEWEIEWYTEDFGSDITISYEITEASRMDEDELEELFSEYDIENVYTNFMYVEAEYTIRGSEDREIDEMIFLIAKSGDGWCLLSDSMILGLL